MRAYVLSGARTGGVQQVEPPRADPGLVVVDVERVGLCGTDVELFTGEMAYLQQGHAAYPLRLGHEWCGVVAATGEGVDPAWVGRRVTGDTMLGCGACVLCRSGRQHLCLDRSEVGIRSGWPGALAEQLAVPASALVTIPTGLGPTAAAMVEPGANALRALQAAAPDPGAELLVLGPGAIGLLVALLALAQGVDVHVVGLTSTSLDLARDLGVGHVWTAESLPQRQFRHVVEASTASTSPARALRLVEPGGRLALIGLSGEPSLVDTRDIALADVTVVGVLSGSGALAETARRYAEGSVDPGRLVAATVGLDRTHAVLGGWRPDDAGPGPKIHVDPRQ